MSRCHEIDVVTSSFSESDHHGRQISKTRFRAFTGVTDVEILAKRAPEVAKAEKNRSRTEPACQGRFLPEMGTVTCNSCPATRLTISDFVGQAIHGTISRTQTAVLHQI
jgi:hypothetical protein